MTLITCQDASFAYDGNVCVSDLNFTVEAGDYLCVVGENGSGKSTLIKGLLKPISPWQGSVLMGGGLKPSDIGYLPQQTAAQKDFPASAYEVVLSGRLGARGMLPFYSKADKAVAEQNIEQFGLGPLRNRCYRELSGGQQQRVLLARALCATRRLLLLDEPAAGLDPMVTHELYHIIESLNRDSGLTVIMVSHDIHCAVEYSSHILHLQNRQLFFGRTQDYLRSEASKAFLDGDSMLETLAEMLSYTFMRGALLVGLVVSLCAALLGVSLVLKRYSMIGDGLSHVGFASLCVATATHTAPLMVSIPVVVLAAFLLLRLSEDSHIKGDAAIALIATSSLALGVIVISMTTGMNVDVYNYMFGSILAMSADDVSLSIGLAVLVLVLFILFYNKIFAVTFDESFAKATGVRTGLYNSLIALLTAITIVLGMRMMGSLLISSLIIFPALTSMRLCKRFKTVAICSAVVAVSCFLIGVTVSYSLAMPTGASVVLVNIGAFLLFSLARLVPWPGIRTALLRLAGRPPE